jgi:cytochrome c oxidase subunit 3
MATIAKPAADARWTGAGNGSGPAGWNGGGPRKSQPDVGLTGMWFALAGIMMLFMGLTSAFIVRRGLDPGWQPIRMPVLAALNAVLLIASSVTLEFGRRCLRANRRPAADKWFLTTWSLGIIFIAGQLIVWGQLAAAGLYLSSNAHSSFFYVLTALHGVHLAGGIAALSWLIWMPLPQLAAGPARPAVWRERVSGIVALYWHFMDGLWVYLLVLLFAFK